MNNKFYTKGEIGQVEMQTINAFIKNYCRKQDGFQIEIKPVKDIRSLQQNAFMWVLATAMERHTGEFKELELMRCKVAFAQSKEMSEIPETSKMDMDEMREFLDFLVKYATETVGIGLTIQELDEWKKCSAWTAGV